MVKFKAKYTNQYSTLLNKGKNDNYEINYRKNKSDVKFISQYSPQISKFNNLIREEDNVELEEIEWEL